MFFGKDLVTKGIKKVHNESGIQCAIYLPQIKQILLCLSNGELSFIDEKSQNQVEPKGIVLENGPANSIYLCNDGSNILPSNNAKVYLIKYNLGASRPEIKS